MSKKLITKDEAKPAKKQHKTPCSDCPWARTAFKGWLGGLTVQQWLARVRGDEGIECHTRIGMQCAGSSIYRANICKVSRDPTVLQLPRNTEIVFGFGEFERHHGEL